MRDLHAVPATGMNFHVVEGRSGLLAVYEDGKAMPLYSDPNFYCVDDLLSGIAVPSPSLTPTPLLIRQSYPTRISAMMALSAAKVMITYPAYTGRAWAFPLVATDTLTTPTRFYRYLTSNFDPRFNGIQLSKGTYLTSIADGAHATSGFGVVGRYALPIPISAHYRMEYVLPSSTVIDVGTVAPNFGQSGGGVEVCLQNDTGATSLGMHTLPEY
jgi:hypothetical protein